MHFDFVMSHKKTCPDRTTESRSGTWTLKLCFVPSSARSHKIQSTHRWTGTSQCGADILIIVNMLLLYSVLIKAETWCTERGETQPLWPPSVTSSSSLFSHTLTSSLLVSHAVLSFSLFLSLEYCPFYFSVITRICLFCWVVTITCITPLS